MFTPYYGELFVSPIPVELSGNLCSHKCAYCFANLNKRDRRIDIDAAFRFVRDFKIRKSWEAELVSMGYPVLISNKSDPFSISNYKVFVPLMRFMSERGIPIAIQTKGGHGVDEVLSFLPRSHWYVSVGYSDDAVRKRIEPGAPPVEARIEMVGELLKRGHAVSVAINPLVEEWEPNPEKLVDKFAAMGVKNFWIETLHLNNNQTRNMTPRELAAIGDRVIHQAYRKSDKGVYAFFKRIIEYTRGSGLNAFCMSYPYATRYFDEEIECYQKTFPTIPGFLNMCIEQKIDLITFDHYREYFESRLPATNRNLIDYVGASNPAIKAKIKNSKLIGWGAFLAATWSIEQSRYNLYRNRAFDYAIDSDGNLIETGGMPTYILSNNGL